MFTGWECWYTHLITFLTDNLLFKMIIQLTVYKNVFTLLQTKKSNY